MNVKELIRALEKLDQDAPIEIETETKYGTVVRSNRVRRVEQVTIDHDGKPFVVLHRRKGWRTTLLNGSECGANSCQ